MKKMILKSALLAFTATSLLATSASAYTLPGYSWGNVEGLLNDVVGAGNYTELTDKDFSGEWNYTAIATEAGHINLVKETPGLDSNATFINTTFDNWGAYDQIDFDTANYNLKFKDTTDGTMQFLDVFAKSDGYFKVFMIDTAGDTDWLSGYGGDITLGVGSLVVGFNDNGPGQQDMDFDDIIVAMNPVPEPATMLLFGAGLAGLAGVARRKKKA